MLLVIWESYYTFLKVSSFLTYEISGYASLRHRISFQFTKFFAPSFIWIYHMLISKDILIAILKPVIWQIDLKIIILWKRKDNANCCLSSEYMLFIADYFLQETIINSKTTHLLWQFCIFERSFSPHTMYSKDPSFENCEYWSSFCVRLKQKTNYNWISSNDNLWVSEMYFWHMAVLRSVGRSVGLKTNLVRSITRELKDLLTCWLVLTCRWPLLNLGFLGQRSRSQWHLSGISQTFLVFDKCECVIKCTCQRIKLTILIREWLHLKRHRFNKKVIL